MSCPLAVSAECAYAATNTRRSGMAYLDPAGIEQPQVEALQKLLED